MKRGCMAIVGVLTGLVLFLAVPSARLPVVPPTAVDDISLTQQPIVVPIIAEPRTAEDDSAADLVVSGSGNDSVSVLTEGSLQENRLPIIPERMGPCRCVPPFTHSGTWNQGEWVPDPSDNSGFVTPEQLVTSVKGFRMGSKIRVLLIGDSIARYLMCFLSKSVAERIPVLNGTGCEPEQTRGVLYQLWPPTPELQKLSPIILHFVSDFYFPETHAVCDLMDLFESENPWLPPVKVVVVSRGTWDNWIRLPRPQVGRQLLFGYSKGLEYIRQRYPDAAISVYALSKQYPSRYHRHSERRYDNIVSASTSVGLLLGSHGKRCTCRARSSTCTVFRYVSNDMGRHSVALQYHEQ